MRSALSSKALERQIMVLDNLELNAPKTKAMLEILDNLNVDSSALILLSRKDEVVQLSTNNIPYVKTLLAQYLNVRDLLTYDYLIMPLEAVEVIESFLA